MNLEKLGTFIHNKREEVGIPLAKAAQKAGIGRSTLWILEQGKNPKTGKPSRPSKDILERLAQALHMSQNELEEALVLADYKVVKQPPQPSNHFSPPHQTGTTQQLTLSTSTTITEINGTVFLASDGYLHAFDAKTGNRLWSSSTGVSPFEPAQASASRDTEQNEISALQQTTEQMQKDIADIRQHIPIKIKREITKLEARLNKDRQGAHVDSTTERFAPTHKGQKESVRP